MPENNENIITNGLEDKDSKYYKDEYERLNKENIQHRRAGVFRFILAAVFIGGGIALAIMNPIGAIGAVLAGGSLGLGLVSFDLANKCMKQVKSPEKINDAVVNLLHDKILKRIKEKEKIKEKDLTGCTKALENISKYFTKRLEEEKVKLQNNPKNNDISSLIKDYEADLKNINDALKEIQPSIVSSKTGEIKAAVVDQKQDINSQSNTANVAVLVNASKVVSGITKIDENTLAESNSRTQSVQNRQNSRVGLG